jgi:hypothetical protein
MIISGTVVSLMVDDHGGTVMAEQPDGGWSLVER